MTRAIAAFGALTTLFLAAPASADPADDAVIAELREQISALNARLDMLEAERKNGAASNTVPATVRPGDPQSAVTAVASLPPPLGMLPTRTTDGIVIAPLATLDRALQNLGSVAELSATTDASTVAIKISGTLSDPGLRGRPEGRASYDVWGITASAPLAMGSNRTDLGTLDGFANGAKLKLKWSRFSERIANPLKNPRYEAIRAAARASCQVQGVGKACAEPIIGDDFIRTYSGTAAQSEYLRLAFPPSPAFAYGLEGSIGYKKYSFLDTGAFARMDTEKVPLGIKGFVSVLPANSLSSVTAALEYQRSYKEGSAVTICPASTGGVVSCLTGAGGAPARKSKALGSLEYRHQFLLSETSFIRSIGLSPQLVYDAENDDFGIDFPVYFVPSDKGPLTGGIRFGYSSDGNDFAVGVFVASAFSIFQ